MIISPCEKIEREAGHVFPTGMMKARLLHLWPLTTHGVLGPGTFEKPADTLEVMSPRIKCLKKSGSYIVSVVA